MTFIHLGWLDQYRTVEHVRTESGRFFISKRSNIEKIRDCGFSFDANELKLLAGKLRINEHDCQAQIVSPYVVKPISISVDAAAAYLILPFVEGKTFTAAITTLSARDALNVITDVARALVDIHSSGVIHRDVKPDNIICSPNGTVTVIDYDLSVRLCEDYFSDHRRTIYTLATPGFEPPEHHHLVQNGLAFASREQVQHLLPTPLTDVYGLGKTLYFAMAHHLELRTHTLESIANAMTEHEAHKRLSMPVLAEKLDPQKHF